MKTYSTTITKAEFVTELKKHQKADAFIRGTYGEGKSGKDFRGCAVGCSLESISRTKKIELDFGNHEAYEEHLGVPEWLARLEDRLFEGVSAERAKTWPVEFAQAIPEGVDLEQVKTPFLIKVLEHSILSMDSVVYDKTKFPDVDKAILQSKEAVQLMIRAHEGAGDMSAARSAAESAAWSAAESAARSAAESAAWSAAESAAESAARSAAESAAWSAAESAARSAACSAASAAESAARSAAWSSASAAWSAAWSAARSAAYDYYADALLEILRQAK